MQPVLILPRRKESLLNDKDGLVDADHGPDPSREFPTRPRCAAFNVSLDHAARATLESRKDATVPQLTLASGSRGFNDPARDWAPRFTCCWRCPGWCCCWPARISPTCCWPIGGAAAGGERPHGAGREPGTHSAASLYREPVALAARRAAGLMLGYLGRNVIPAANVQLLADRRRFDGRFDWEVFAFTAGCLAADRAAFRTRAGPAVHARQREHRPERRRCSGDQAAAGAWPGRPSSSSRFRSRCCWWWARGCLFAR
jgi:hypothetical protein